MIQDGEMESLNQMFWSNQEVYIQKVFLGASCTLSIDFLAATLSTVATWKRGVPPRPTGEETENGLGCPFCKFSDRGRVLSWSDASLDFLGNPPHFSGENH
jgi:hypothetical protein